MKTEKIPFFKPCFDDLEKKALVQALSTPNNLRDYIDSFEQAFSIKFGFKYCLAVNSGTAALHLILLSMKLEKGDMIGVTNMVCPAVLNVIEQVNCIPIIFDVNDNDGNICIEALRHHPQLHKLKALIVVHFGGIPAQIKEIMAIINPLKILLIEDSAQALAAYLNKKMCGKFGKVSFFSFYANKHITTAEGGMIATNNKYFFKKIKRIYSPLFHSMYEINPTSAVLGTVQLEKVVSFLEERKKIANTYTRLFSDCTKIKLINIKREQSPSWHCFSIQFLFKKDNFLPFLKEINKKLIIYPEIVPIHRHKFYKEKYNLSDSQYPGTCAFYCNRILLPIYPGLNQRDTQYIATSILHELRKYA